MLTLNEWFIEKKDDPHVLINGDNIQVLSYLHGDYDKKISCIYIDPPYNTGESYIFYDDGAPRDNWIIYMKNILNELYPLLREDGSLWISINDREMHYLKVLCDEVFGRKNYVATIVWQQRNTRENRKIFSNNQEYILVYSPNPEAFKKKRNMLPITDEILSRYKNPDNDPRGPWQSISANVQAGHAVPSQFYEIVAPNGKKHSPPQGRCWVYSQDKMLQEIQNGNIWFGSDGNGVPRIKKFLADSKKGVVPETLWLAEFAGTNSDAKTHLQQMGIYDKDLFDTPKPELMLKRIIEISTNEKEIVLDAFLGSGTTTAVAHKLQRNYIGIENSQIVYEYAKKRMEAVINGEKGGISSEINWDGGGKVQYVSA